MADRNELFLHEEVLLLALRDEKGTPAAGAMYTQAMGGAILAELLIGKRVRMDAKKHKFIELESSRRLGDPVLDECLVKVRDAKRRATAVTWVSRFTAMSNLHRVAQGLCRRKILRADEDTVLLLFKRKVYPEIDPGPERAIIETLRKAIFTDARDVDPRTVVLVSLAKSSNLLPIIFDKKELKGRKDRLENLINGDVTGKATKEAIEAAQAAAFMAAVIIPAVVTTTVTS